MSLFKRCGLHQPVVVSQVRFATKRVSGSKTNKNDSAGRRLGPKAHEGHFVKPGEILMRQRGTKIHPGENTGIGKDHTIFALEPGYVRFYRDPFHPLRKYVGLALKKDLTLPLPHFEPRVRRFGYTLLTDPAEAAKEEAHMSRKEFLAQPELLRGQQRREENKQALFNSIANAVKELGFPETYTQRLGEIAQLVKAGQTTAFAALQVTYNHVFEAQLAERRGEPASEAALYVAFAEELDSQVSVDHTGVVFKVMDPETLEARKQAIVGELQLKHSNQMPSEENDSRVQSLINEPGVFSREERAKLTLEYLPKEAPLTAPGSVLDVKGKVPKDAVVQRLYKDGHVEVIVRPKSAFRK